MKQNSILKSLVKPIALIFFSFFAYSSSAISGGYVGNGGDPLRELFEGARAIAVKKLNELDSCTFSRSALAQDFKTPLWILQNRWRITADILSSPHELVNETFTTGTCALTQAEARAKIFFSLASCHKENLTPEVAASVLIHESIHHLGFTDETFSTKVASTVAQSLPQLTCFSEDPINPFMMPGNRNVVGLSSSEARELLLKDQYYFSLRNIARSNYLRPSISDVFSTYSPIFKRTSFSHGTPLIFAEQNMISAQLHLFASTAEAPQVTLSLAARCGSEEYLFARCRELKPEGMTCDNFPHNEKCPHLSSNLFKFFALLTRDRLVLTSLAVADKDTLVDQGAIIWIP